MNASSKVIGVSALVTVLAAVTTLVVLNKPLPVLHTEQKPAPPKLSALEEYLANPPVVVDAPWAKSTPPHESIPNSLKQFTSGDTEHKRAVAIGFLAYTADQMARVPETQDAAKEVLEKWVIPNIDMTKMLPHTSGYRWKNTVSSVGWTYKNLGNQAASRAYFALICYEGKTQDDREQAVYHLAYDFIKSQEYQEAIDTYNTLPADSRWADQRPRIIEIWKNKLAEKEKAEQQTQDQQKSER